MFIQSFTAMIALAASLAAAATREVTVTAPVKRAKSVHLLVFHDQLWILCSHVFCSNGIGTIYQQLGGYGSCGDQHSDYDMIAALGMDWMQYQYKAPYCGRRLRLRNTGSNDGVGGQGNVIEVTVADSCQACDRNHVDLSVGAWNALTNNAAWGTVNIEWLVD